jgi:hypothetical protein
MGMGFGNLVLFDSVEEAGVGGVAQMEGNCVSAVVCVAIRGDVVVGLRHAAAGGWKPVMIMLIACSLPRTSHHCYSEFYYCYPIFKESY